VLGGRKIVKENSEKFQLIKGLTKSACESIGGIYKELDGVPVCIVKKDVDKHGFERIVRDFDVEVLDATGSQSG